MFLCKQIEERLQPDALPLDLLGSEALYVLNKTYAITISCNKATKRSAYKAYDAIISQLPCGFFFWTRELSKRKKHHIHGILILTYPFDYKRLMESKDLLDGVSYDVHIHYSALKTEEEFSNWYKYMTKSIPTDLYYTETPQLMSLDIETCIPIVYTLMTDKLLHIPGL